MSKHAFVFPGQGSQFSGMCKALYEINDLAKELFEQANHTIGFRISDIMFNGTDEQLKQTNITQPAIFLHSIIAYKVFNYYINGCLNSPYRGYPFSYGLNISDRSNFLYRNARNNRNVDLREKEAGKINLGFHCFVNKSDAEHFLFIKEKSAYLKMLPVIIDPKDVILLGNWIWRDPQTSYSLENYLQSNNSFNSIVCNKLTINKENIN